MFVAAVLAMWKLMSRGRNSFVIRTELHLSGLSSVCFTLSVLLITPTGV